MGKSEDINFQIPIKSLGTISDAENIMVGPLASGVINDIIVLR